MRKERRKQRRKGMKSRKKEKRNWASAELPSGTNLSQTCHIAISFSACYVQVLHLFPLLQTAVQSQWYNEKKSKNPVSNMNSLLKSILNCKRMGTFCGTGYGPALEAGHWEQNATAAWPCPLLPLAEVKACSEGAALLTPHQRVWQRCFRCLASGSLQFAVILICSLIIHLIPVCPISVFSLHGWSWEFKFHSSWRAPSCGSDLLSRLWMHESNRPCSRLGLGAGSTLCRNLSTWVGI